jgi:endonuclease G
MSVFTGPIFKNDDIIYGGMQIPDEYWKVIVFANSRSRLAALGFIMSQKEYLSKLDEHEARFSAVPFQVPITEIERLTGLSFGDLKGADPVSAGELEGARITPIAIRNFDDIVL